MGAADLVGLSAPLNPPNHDEFKARRHVRGPR